MNQDELRNHLASRVTHCNWSEFLELADAYNFRLRKGKGSRRKLIHPSGLIVTVHEPHPSKRPVHPEAVKALLRAISTLEASREGKD